MSEPLALYVSERFLRKLARSLGCSRLRAFFATDSSLKYALARLGVPFEPLKERAAREIIARYPNVACCLLPGPSKFPRWARAVYTFGARVPGGAILQYRVALVGAGPWQWGVSAVLWLVVPASRDAEDSVLGLLRAIAGLAGAPPLTEREWLSIRLLARELGKHLGARGITDNLWGQVLQRSSEEASIY